MQTVVEESRAQGTIGLRLYVKYLKAGANVMVLLFVILINILAQVEVLTHTGNIGALSRPLFKERFYLSSRCRTSCRTGGWLTGRWKNLVSRPARATVSYRLPHDFFLSDSSGLKSRTS